MIAELALTSIDIHSELPPQRSLDGAWFSEPVTVLTLHDLLNQIPVLLGETVIKGYRVEREWQITDPGPGVFGYLTDIAIDSSNSVYVADLGYSRIQKFTSDGEFIEFVYLRPRDHESLQQPIDIDLDSFDNLYATDGNMGVNKVTSNGEFVVRWQVETGVSPDNIALDPSDNVYVLDTVAHLITKFTSEGELITSWVIEGAAGEEQNESDIAVDTKGNVYTLDSFNNNVSKFTAEGDLIDKWGYESTEFIEEEFGSQGERIALDSSGNVYVVDPNENGIHVFTSTGEPIEWRPYIGWKRISDITIDSTNNMYVIDLDKRIVKFQNGDQSSFSSWGHRNNVNLGFSDPERVALDSSGNVYVSDANTHSIKKFTSDGKFVARWELGQNMHGSVGGIGIDSDDNVFIAEPEYSVIRKFTSDGKIMEIPNLEGLDYSDFYSTRGGRNGDEHYFGLEGIALDSADNMYILNSANGTIQKFTNDGRHVSTWGQTLGQGEFGYQDPLVRPQSLAVSSTGNVYVADTDNHRIVKYTNNGEIVSSWGIEGIESGEFSYPAGIALDSSENVYVADSDNNRIQKFTSEGKFLMAWGSRGSDKGKFLQPIGIAIDSSGNVYVADSQNSRVQVFAPIYLPISENVEALALIGGVVAAFAAGGFIVWKKRRDTRVYQQTIKPEKFK